MINEIKRTSIKQIPGWLRGRRGKVRFLPDYRWLFLMRGQKNNDDEKNDGRDGNGDVQAAESGKKGRKKICWKFQQMQRASKCWEADKNRPIPVRMCHQSF